MTSYLHAHQAPETIALLAAGTLHFSNFMASKQSGSQSSGLQNMGSRARDGVQTEDSKR